MARPGIQGADVLRAMEEIEAQGKTPTVREVNRFLGTGSSATISRWMAIIRAKRTSAPQIDARPPDSIQELANSLVNELWKSSLDLATKENRRLRQKLHEFGYGAQPIIDQLEEVTGGLRAHLEELHAEADSGLVIAELPTDNTSNDLTG